MKHICITFLTAIICLISIFTFSPILSQAAPSSFLNPNVVQNNDGSLEIKVDKKGSLEEDRKATTEAFVKYFKKYNIAITFVSGMATLTMFIFFIRNFIKLVSTGTESWILKRSVMVGLLWSGIATALLGSATVIIGLTLNVF